MIKVDSTRLRFLIEGHNTQNGVPYYILSVSTFRIKLMDINSVLDIINNNALGFVKEHVTNPINNNEDESNS